MHPVVTVSRKVTREYEPTGKFDGGDEGVRVEVADGAASPVCVGVSEPVPAGRESPDVVGELLDRKLET